MGRSDEYGLVSVALAGLLCAVTLGQEHRGDAQKIVQGLDTIDAG